LKCERRRHDAPPSRAYSRLSPGKSSKSGTLLAGKIIPYKLPERLRNVWNGALSGRLFRQREELEASMYIGLGGLLILVLILWLLGVI
jgi:hypothetical protein